MNFPESISFTITNRCNLRCQMCGQWSEEGYIRAEPEVVKGEMDLADWKRLVDEVAEHKVSSILLRGGEPFLFPGIMELIRHIKSKGIWLSIDTNGTRIAEHAEELVSLGDLHITMSLDGTEEVHDAVRGVKGTFAKVHEASAALLAAEKKLSKTISKSFCFTISRYSVDSLGDLPEAIHSLGIKGVSIVPYYYFPKAVGEAYDKELRENFDCPAYSWVGFHHEESGVDADHFIEEYRQFQDGLRDISNYPYLPMTETDYRTWFSDAVTPVMPAHCNNVERLIDIQPNGDANFCVDLIDFKMGNVRESTIAEVWNSERAERFRAYRREKPLPVCLRCGAKYMSEHRDAVGNVVD